MQASDLSGSRKTDLRWPRRSFPKGATEKPVSSLILLDHSGAEFTIRPTLPQADGGTSYNSHSLT